MADLLRSGAAWLADRLKESAGSTIVYVRGPHRATMTATIGTSRFEAQGANGVVEQWESRDYIVSAGSLPSGEPERGDRIFEEYGTETVTYEVVTPRGVPTWHYADAFQQTIRIHTKRVDVKR